MAIPVAPPTTTRRRGNPNWGRPIPPTAALATEFELRVRHLHLTPEMYADHAEFGMTGTMPNSGLCRALLRDPQAAPV